ncbi:MAG: hypothetical protein LBP67_01590 [Bacteroidales bacterium]|jgi:hypothetical protein|nr:hypothetical protein [Bacteroidales bacterium]
MKSKDKKIVSEQKFHSFIFSKDQALDWIIICGICILAYIILKIFYPFPATVTDSGGYVVCAQKDFFSFYRPFGYSFFLQQIYAISKSIHAVFIAQMIIYLISVAFFSFTLKYFFKPNKKAIWYTLLVLFTCNPIAFFMANSIMSDMLFAVLIYFMLALLIFIIKKKSYVALIFFLIFLFCSLHVRYTAMIFPFVFIPILFMKKGSIRWVAAFSMILISVIFYNQIKSSMKKTTGFNQFSTGFDGWQLANNALHILPFIDLKPEEIDNPQIRNLHAFSIPYKDLIAEKTNNGRTVTARILWQSDFPLKQYLSESIKINRKPYATMWIALGSGVYSDYGRYLILHYPVKFMRYYYFPNMVNMFYPTHTGIMKEYKIIDGKDILDWYNISDTQNLECKNDIYGKFLAPLSKIITLISWILIIGIGVISIINKKKINFDRDEKIIFWGLFIFAGIYYASTIFASPIELRYWLPMSCVKFAFCYILLNKLSVYKIKELLPTRKNKNG